MEYLLGQTTDKKERAYLINHFLEQFKGTLFRQTMFAEFELNIGRMIGEGQTLTAEALCAEYRKLNEMYFGPDMVVDDEIAMEWARIPHFYYNYYVFQYATGYSAAIALSRKILSEGESAVKDYINFLSGGCSKSPIDLLRDAGLKAKGIVYEEEGGFCLDYPDSDEIYRRYKQQGVLTEEEVTEALQNTLVFDNSEGITIDKEFKIPKITDGDSNKALKKLINDGWAKERNNVPKEKRTSRQEPHCC